MKSLRKAIEICGGSTALANRINVGQSTVSMWLKRENIPAERVIDIERATNGEVTRHDLRPDLYPIEKPADPRVTPGTVADRAP